MDRQEDAKRASAIASLLLVAGEPVSSRTLCRLLDVDRRQIDSAVDCLVADLATSGIRLQIHNDRLQLATAPENSDVVRRFLELPRQPKLTRPSLETLSLIAYRQPITRGELEQVRGVNVDRIVSNLLSRGWIEETGRRETPGRPIEYGTTTSFLELFGLSSLDELPTPEQSDTIRRAPLTILGLRSGESLGA